MKTPARRHNKTPERVTELLQHDIDSGMSLRAVCRKIDLHPNTVGAYLEGSAEPKTDQLEKIAAAYNTSVSWLRGDTEIMVHVEPVSHRLTPVQEAIYDLLEGKSEEQQKKLLDALRIMTEL